MLARGGKHLDAVSHTLVSNPLIKSNFNGQFNVTSPSAAKKSRKEQAHACSTQGGGEGLGFGPQCWSSSQVLCMQSDDEIRSDDQCSADPNSDHLRLRCWYWQLDGTISTITMTEVMPAMK